MTTDDAAQVWALMRDFVERHSPRHRLRQALGDGLAKGRSKVQVLLMLGDGPHSLSDIAEAQRIDKPYATAIVDQLEQLGLATRTSDPDDRRRKMVALTQAGRSAVVIARDIMDEPPAVLAGLSPAELTQLAAALGRLAEQRRPRPD
ncbi:MarR family winged helix-turn-helix transcriptional regulator [Actinoplanes sp. NPDC051343]|uniref:MarR family winged helix-turn-helix transcriptional regulator n=1 Tax=Actinoplanes sp. NPDC051343 TaxID=3363906 RepID=UPI0037957CD7